MFCFIPFIFGCQTKITPDGDLQTPRLCPRCNNGAVVRATTKEYLEIFFVPVVPMSSKHIWICGICSWSTSVQPDWEPMPVSHPGFYPPQVQSPQASYPGPKGPQQ